VLERGRVVVPLLLEGRIVAAELGDEDALERDERRRLHQAKLFAIDRGSHGAAHFDVAEQRGVELVDELRRRLPGYLVPRFVREVPGELSKTPIG